MTNEPTQFRTNLLRLLYLIMAIGLAVTVWPLVLAHETEQVRAATGAQCMMAAMADRHCLTTDEWKLSVEMAFPKPLAGDQNDTFVADRVIQHRAQTLSLDF
ncbi:MAG: hypothetical protein HC774_00035 [Sphingomonadales bacterium]|nr:hypothetical protein [Sphingomonadales bacterium]